MYGGCTPQVTQTKLRFLNSVDLVCPQGIRVLVWGEGMEWRRGRLISNCDRAIPNYLLVLGSQSSHTRNHTHNLNYHLILRLASQSQTIFSYSPQNLKLSSRPSSLFTISSSPAFSLSAQAQMWAILCVSKESTPTCK